MKVAPASTDRICKNCQQPFTRVVRAAQKYCSQKCRVSFWNKECSKSSSQWNKRNPERVMLRSAKHRAKRQGVPFDLELEDLVIPEYCPVLGLRLECNAGEGSAKQNSPSLDKIIPSLGYIKGNIQIISNLANVMKHDASPEQLVNFAEWVLKTYSTEETQ